MALKINCNLGGNFADKAGNIILKYVLNVTSLSLKMQHFVTLLFNSAHSNV